MKISLSTFFSKNVRIVIKFDIFLVTKFEIDITCEFFVSGDRASGYRYFEGTCQLLEDYREMSGISSVKLMEFRLTRVQHGEIWLG